MSRYMSRKELKINTLKCQHGFSLAAVITADFYFLPLIFSIYPVHMYYFYR